MTASKASDAYASFLATISDKPEAFLHPTDALHAAAVVVSKRLLDPLAKSNSVFDQIYTEGLHVEQIWEQVKTVTENVVDDILIMDLPKKDTQTEEISLSEDEEAADDSANSEVQSEMDGLDGDSFEEFDDHDEDEEMLEDGGRDVDEDDVSLPAELQSDENEQELGITTASFERDVHGLNDEFFNIDDFNKQTEIMDANYAQEQSEDDIDYNADPDEASDMEDLEREAEEEDNANEVRYDDFFAPPKRSAGRSAPTKRRRTRIDAEEDESVAMSEDDVPIVDENEDHTIARMQKDLFADDESEGAEESGPRLSTHAKRQLKLAEEIRRLEDDNVAKKDWTLMGEASARARPKDSLLEEGLDFERTSRPVPIVTEEVTQTLEDMIKARIIEGRFDTVLRKIPESAHKFTKSSFELDESKPSQSLAEVYENEFQKKQNPGDFKTAKDLKLETEHKEIEALFRDVCYNLDSLSSWHYTPKPVTETLNIVTNAPAIAMEDAQPLTMSSASRLAPQEQFKAAAEKGEVSSRSGLPVAKAEMSSEEKQRYRRKQRAVAKKSGAQKKPAIAAMSRSKQEQAGVIDTLKKANVKVIRNGKTKDLRTGKDYNGSTASIKPGNLKL